MNRRPERGMNQQLRKLGAGLLVCYLALFVMVNYVQVVAAPALNDRTDNTRALVRDFDQPRGEILSADGQLLAQSLPAAPESPFELQRVYPAGDLFAHVTGFLNFDFGAEGLERSYNDQLAGQTFEQEYESVSDLFVERDTTGDLTLTLRADVQQVARDALGEQRGSVVAVDPRDGSVLAFWSFPSFDPNPLSAHDIEAARAARTALEPDVRTSPLSAAMYRQSFFPGSTFKIVTAAVGVEAGVVTATEPVYPVVTEYDIDFTERGLSNFGGSSCGGDLFASLRVSCNSTFASMGADTIGETRMVEGVESFGFNDRPPIDLPAAATSTFPTEFPDDVGNGTIARASIGQGDTQATPLQMALVTAGIANRGVIMRPHVVDRITDDAGQVIEELEAEPWTQAVSPASADVVRRAMVAVVDDGTASGLAIPGMEVGGKTGTAQLGTDPPSSHAWIVGFAGPPGQPSTVAVAVLVEAQAGVSEVTGGRVAAPIARAVMERVLQVQAEGGG
jgi:peptidoglycan glycosyltransferase